MNDTILLLDHRYQDFLRDESRTPGRAETISFPENEAEVRKIVTLLSQQGVPVTVQGSRTGIAGGAVPLGGHILNLSKMDRITGMTLDPQGRFRLQVHPGVTLADLDRHVSEKRFNTRGWDKASLRALETFKKAGPWFWPPDPSEKTASVGGMAAVNARGICGFRYGSARRHISAIRVVDTRARVHCIQRGRYCFDHGICPLPGGGELHLDPDLFDSGQGDDLIDLYLGSEGMLGVITGVELNLAPRPSQIWGVVFFFTDQARAMDFIESLSQNPDTEIAAVEFMDHSTLESIQDFKQAGSQLSALPDLDPLFDSAVCIVIHSRHMDRVDAVSERLMASAETHGCDLDRTWAFCNDNEMERFYRFRHAAPESLNLRVDIARQKDPRICKLGTDMQSAHLPLSGLVEMYQHDLGQYRLKAAVFGHAGDGILHVNILPQNFDEYTRAKGLMRQWADSIHSRGGSVVTEHGIGKIKPHLFRSVPLSRQAARILKLKDRLDPDGLWNPGNMKEQLPEDISG